jgi:putative nucleotidyltransferase with HDIG domain
MTVQPPIEVLRERFKAFLVFLKTKLLASGADLDRLSQLRRLSDMRIRQFSIGKPHLTVADLSGLLADPRIGRLDGMAEQAGLVRAGHLALPLASLGEEMGYTVEICLTLQVIGAETMRGLLKEFVARNGAAADAPGLSAKAAPARAVATPLPPAVAKLLGNVRELWTIPANTARILDLLQAPDAPADAVCAEIEKDPGLAAQCLRVVNSANYALGTRIASVKRAVVTLGYAMTRRIVSISSLVTTLGRPHADLEFDLKQFWHHSLWVAHAAALVSRASRLGHPDEHFAAGLVHDLGKLVAYQYLRAPMKEILAAVRGGASYGEEERRRLGTDHAEIGACLAERWRFPPSIVEAARHHLDTPEQLEELQLPREAIVVAAACRLSRHGVGAERLDGWGGLLRLAPDRMDEVSVQAAQLSSGSLNEVFVIA